jgi:hypothetical protein
MKSVAIFLFIIFATSLVGGCSTQMIQKANMACKVIYGITNLLYFKDDSNTDVDWNYILKESERYEDITR